MKELEQIALSLKALADPNRLAILNMLTQGERCACELLEELHIHQSTLSHHMRILREAELVSSRKEGKWMHYTLAPEVIGRCIASLEALNVIPPIVENRRPMCRVEGAPN